VKYDPLTDYLSRRKEQSLVIGIPELEAVLGSSLPKSAYQYRAWWANGGHIQADSWLNAGWRVDWVDFSRRTVRFIRTGAPCKSAENQGENSVLTVCGYLFRFVQELQPERDDSGNIKTFFPQRDYTGDKPLHAFGDGAFCRFSVRAGNIPGVYLWVLDGHILYIGETMNFQRRFNVGYGNIEPINCYIGGQTTNCKMNKLVLSLAQQEKYVKLYFHETKEHKRVELELLGKVQTPYNVKDN